MGQGSEEETPPPQRRARGSMEIASQRKGGNPPSREKKGKARSDGETGGGPSKERERKQPSQIRNKLKRAEQTQKLRVEKKKSKKRRLKERQKEEDAARALGEAPPPRPVPKTIESTREYDDSSRPLTEDEVREADAQDELAPLFNRERPPKVLITSCPRPTKVMYKLIRELLCVIPGAQFYERRSYQIKEIVKYASNRDFTAVVVINENQKTPNGLLLIALPHGPTAHFRLSSLVLSKSIKNHGRPTTHLPELILNNFTTHLGHRVGRVLGALFPQDPQFRGRRVITFHNQRDFIFFRHHRYIFEGEGVEPRVNDDATEGDGEGKQTITKTAGTKRKSPEGREGDLDVSTRLQECGPRFTLKLLSLQKGALGSKDREYEWVHKRSQETSRRKFVL